MKNAKVEEHWSLMGADAAPYTTQWGYTVTPVVLHHRLFWAATPRKGRTWRGHIAREAVGTWYKGSPLRLWIRPWCTSYHRHSQVIGERLPLGVQPCQLCVQACLKPTSPLEELLDHIRRLGEHEPIPPELLRAAGFPPDPDPDQET